MSEREILNRQQYKKNRKNWIFIQTVALVVVAVIALGCFLTYHRLDRTYYIEYTEDCETDYQVVYQENEYFDDLVRGEDQTYIAHLIDHITADFQYQMGMDASDVSLDYSYSIMAQVVVEDKYTGKELIAKYKEFIKIYSLERITGNMEKSQCLLEDLLLHNEEDIINLLQVTKIEYLEDVFRGNIIYDDYNHF